MQRVQDAVAPRRRALLRLLQLRLGAMPTNAAARDLLSLDGGRACEVSRTARRSTYRDMYQLIADMPRRSASTEPGSGKHGPAVCLVGRVHLANGAYP